MNSRRFLPDRMRERMGNKKPKIKGPNVLLLGNKTTGKSTVARMMESMTNGGLVHVVTRIPNIILPYKMGTLAPTKHGHIIGVIQYNEQLKRTTGELTLEDITRFDREGVFTQEDYKLMARILSEEYGPAIMYLVPKMFAEHNHPQHPSTFDGVRYVEAVEYAKTMEEFIAYIDVPEDELVRRVVDNDLPINDPVEARRLLDEEDRLYGITKCKEFAAKYGFVVDGMRNANEAKTPEEIATEVIAAYETFASRAQTVLQPNASAVAMQPRTMLTRQIIPIPCQRYDSSVVQYQNAQPDTSANDSISNLE